MGNFFAELKRRHIYRVAAAYAVVAWVLIQLVSNVSPMLRLPDWAGTLVLVLLLVGFPVALLFAWIHQLAPADGATARATTGKLDWVLIGALVVVIALVSYQQLAPTTGARTAQGNRPASRPGPTSRRRHLHRRAALREPVVGQGAGILLRRHDRGDHLRARQRCRTCAWSGAPRLSSSKARTRICARSARRSARRI